MKREPRGQKAMHDRCDIHEGAIIPTGCNDGAQWDVRRCAVQIVRQFWCLMGQRDCMHKITCMIAPVVVPLRDDELRRFGGRGKRHQQQATERAAAHDYVRSTTTARPRGGVTSLHDTKVPLSGFPLSYPGTLQSACIVSRSAPWKSLYTERTQVPYGRTVQLYW